MNSKTKGNIGVASAISHFISQDHSVFLPVSDDGGAVDLVVSPDGIKMLRVQCKYTSYRRQGSKDSRYYPVYEVTCQKLVQHHRIDRVAKTTFIYNETSFDLMYVLTPGGAFLIPWLEFHGERDKPMKKLRITSAMEKYRVSTLDLPDGHQPNPQAPGRGRPKKVALAVERS